MPTQPMETEENLKEETLLSHLIELRSRLLKAGASILVVFPLMFAFFTSAAPAGVAVMTDIASYLDFVLVLFFAFGLAFEVPIATVVLVWSGLTTVETLAKNRAYVFLGAFVIGMLITPPDIISQTLLAVPVYLLYECGILLSKILTNKKKEAGQ